VSGIDTSVEYWVSYGNTTIQKKVFFDSTSEENVRTAMDAISKGMKDNLTVAREVEGKHCGEK
jgi:hypothetical protein